jgi:hypothetical protein
MKSAVEIFFKFPKKINVQTTDRSVQKFWGLRFRQVAISPIPAQRAFFLQNYRALNFSLSLSAVTALCAVTAQNFPRLCTQVRFDVHSQVWGFTIIYFKFSLYKSNDMRPHRWKQPDFDTCCFAV